jgi:oligosaccharide repeat unit polymerase
MLLETIVCSLLLIITVSISNYCFEDYLNPINIVFGPFFFFYVAFLFGNSFYDFGYNLSPAAKFMLFGSLAAFALGSLTWQALVKSKGIRRRTALQIYNYKRVRFLIHTYFLIGFASWLVLASSADYSLLHTDPNRFRSEFGIPIVSVLFQLIYASGWLALIYICKFGKKSGLLIWLEFLLIPACIFLRLSKSNMIFYILTLTFFYHYYIRKMNPKKLLFVASILILIVLIVPLLRTVHLSEYVLTDYDPEKLATYYYEYAFNYTGASIKNIELAVQNEAIYTKTFGIKLLTPFWQSVRLRDDINVQFGAYSGSELIRDAELGSGVFTPFMISLFQDFGLLGSAIPFVFGFMVSFIYYWSLYRNHALFQGMLPVMATCLVLSCIDNFFLRTGPLFLLSVSFLSFAFVNERAGSILISPKKRRM